MNGLTLAQKLAIWALPLIFAITLHEVAHGWVANRLGDNTAKRQGRLTMNPISHIDPIGTLLVPAILLYLGGFIFGWAKPVPVDSRRLNSPNRDMAIVAAAGPLSNGLMALFWALVIKLGLLLQSAIGPIAFFMVLTGKVGVLINTVLMVLNLLPIPPLDGSRVVTSLLSPRLSDRFREIEPMGFLILVGLLATGILSKIIGPPITQILFVYTEIIFIRVISIKLVPRLDFWLREWSFAVLGTAYSERCNFL